MGGNRDCSVTRVRTIASPSNPQRDDCMTEINPVIIVIILNVGLMHENRIDKTRHGQ